MVRKRENLSVDEWVAYLNGDPPKWFVILVLAAGLAAMSGALYVIAHLIAATGASPDLSTVVAGGALIAGVLVLWRPGAHAWNALEYWLSRRRRLAEGMLATASCPDACDCREHLLARVAALEQQVKASTLEPR